IVAASRAAPMPRHRRTSDLLAVADWLREAVQAHLAASVADDVDRIARLSDVLEGAAAGESDRDLVVAWAEAVGAWHHVEVLAYIDDFRGQFVRETSSSASDGGAPETLE